MKLLVLLGAGSSCAQVTSQDGKARGFPLVAALNEEISKWAKNYASDAGTTDCYGELWKLRATYNKRDGDEWLEPINYEQVMGDFNALLNGVREAPFGDPILEKAAEGMGFASDYGRFMAAQDQLRNLVTRLANRFRETSRSFAEEIKTNESSQFSSYKSLLVRLAAEFDLGIYNLNYDTVALNAVSGPFFTGFGDDGQFLPTEVHARKNWSFVYHLHGSVHYSFNDEPDDRIAWKEKLDGNFKDTKSILTEGADHRVRIASTIIAGGSKLDQLQDEPFQTFYSTLPRHAHEADAILIGGYGFGDHHVNSVLTNAILHRMERIPILLLEKSSINTCPKIGELVSPRTPNSPWMRAQNTLRLTGLGRPGPAQAAHNPFFECLDDRRRPTAVWLDGFETAGSEAEAVIQWLKHGSFT